MIWRFLPVKDERGKDEWGYIEHLSSGKILHPFGGGHDPWDETHLVLHRDRHRGALFKIDQVNNHIIHMSGKYVHPRFGRSDAGNYTQVTLHSNLHKHMEFRCFSIDNPNKTFLVYGAPIVGGEWKIIHKAINPTVDCTLAIDVKLGCASAEKVRETERFKYRWEASFGVENVEYFSQSASQLLKHYIGVSSPQTWEDETTTKIEVKCMYI
ncbi:uncharacterized protein LOC127872078 [Dreissena polymorpha]|uniref:uncharacterized protein LOC127872078 n=1 Tax=Dreissena polymorpha TaxID=45954 RepID=UPI002264826A|nr:uncharacterized protein LOC127872078 [Dreissena polymorpha]